MAFILELRNSHVLLLGTLNGLPVYHWQVRWLRILRYKVHIFFFLLNLSIDIRGHLILLGDSWLSTYWVVLRNYQVRAICWYSELLRHAVLWHVLIRWFNPASHALVAAQVFWELRLVVGEATLNDGGVRFHWVVIRNAIDDRPRLYLDIISCTLFWNTKPIDLILWTLSHIFKLIRLIIFPVLTCRLCDMAFWLIVPLGVLSDLISKKWALIFIILSPCDWVIIFIILQKGIVCTLDHIFIGVIIVVEYYVITSLVTINIIRLRWLLDLFFFGIVAQRVISLPKVKL